MAKKTFDGIVVPSDWNEDDLPLSVALLLEDGEELPVVMDSVGQQLLDFIDEDVQLEAELVEDEAQGQVLRVSKFEVFEIDYDDEDDDEDDEDDE